VKNFVDVWRLYLAVTILMVAFVCAALPVCARAQTAGAGVLSMRCAGGEIKVDAVDLSDGTSVSGYFDVTTPVSSCNGKLATFEVGSYPAIGVTFAYGTALGNYAPDGAPVPCVIAFMVIGTADGRYFMQVTLADYRPPYARLYDSGLVLIASGLVVIDGQLTRASTRPNY
jgi:hypothetical protein